MLYILILAGGPGTRLWPLCRKNNPKQFLKFPADKSLLLQSVERARKLVPDERIFISTRERYGETLFKEIPDFPVQQVLLEPYRRDTGPAVALIVSYLRKFDPSATLAVFTADHLITDIEAFEECIKKGARIAEQYAAPVVFGIKPTRPETAFGYLEGGSVLSPDQPMVRKLTSFKEKPDRSTAERYLAQGNYYWNSGMFIWQVKVIAELYQKYAPEIWEGAKAISEVGFKAAHFATAYASLPSISVDLAIMEKITEGYIVEATFSWEDIGSWRAYASFRPEDASGNRASGPVVSQDSKGCLFEVGSKLVAAIGVEDLVVVDTPDALLICGKERDQEVKDLLKEMEAREFGEFL